MRHRHRIDYGWLGAALARCRAEGDVLGLMLRYVDWVLADIIGKVAAVEVVLAEPPCGWSVAGWSTGSVIRLDALQICMTRRGRTFRSADTIRERSALWASVRLEYIIRVHGILSLDLQWGGPKDRPADIWVSDNLPWQDKPRHLRVNLTRGNDYPHFTNPEDLGPIMALVRRNLRELAKQKGWRWPSSDAARQKARIGRRSP